MHALIHYPPAEPPIFFLFCTGETRPHQQGTPWQSGDESRAHSRRNGGSGRTGHLKAETAHATAKEESDPGRSSARGRGVAVWRGGRQGVRPQWLCAPAGAAQASWKPALRQRRRGPRCPRRLKAHSGEGHGGRDGDLAAVVQGQGQQKRAA